MHTINSTGEGGFVPHVAVLLGLVLAVVAVVAVAVLAVFIHYLAGSIQSGTIAKGVADDTLRTIEGLFPDALDGDEKMPDANGA